MARLGGDDFAVLVEGLSTIDDAHVIAERIIAALGQPAVLPETTVHTRGTLGIAHSLNANSASNLPPGRHCHV